MYINNINTNCVHVILYYIMINSDENIIFFYSKRNNT